MLIIYCFEVKGISSLYVAYVQLCFFSVAYRMSGSSCGVFTEFKMAAAAS